MKILIIKSVFVIALMLLITPLNAQSLKPLSKDKRDSTLISIAKKYYRRKHLNIYLNTGNLLFRSVRFILNLRKLKEKNLSLALIMVLRMARFTILSNSPKMNL